MFCDCCVVVVECVCVCVCARVCVCVRMCASAFDLGSFLMRIIDGQYDEAISQVYVSGHRKILVGEN